MNGVYCRCSEQLAPIEIRRWRIRSIYYSMVASNRGKLLCLCCGEVWTTTAKYVDNLKYLSKSEQLNWLQGVRESTNPELDKAWELKRRTGR
jgi:hypothetical protein